MYKWYVPTLWPEWFCLEPLLSTRGKYDRLMSLNGEKPAKGKVTWTAHLCYKLGWWTMLTHPIQRTILYIQYASILDLIYFTKTQLFILGLDGFFLFAFDEKYICIWCCKLHDQKNHQKTQWLLGSDPKAQKYDTSLPKSHNEEIVSPTQEGQHHWSTERVTSKVLY